MILFTDDEFWKFFDFAKLASFILSSIWQIIIFVWPPIILKKVVFLHAFLSNLKFITMALEINNNNFEEITKSDKLVIIDFWATWCGPCRALSPIMDELSEEYKDDVIIGKCDTEENNDIAMQFGVRNIPMLVFLKNGEVVETLVGLQRKPDLVKLIDSLK